MRILMLAPLVLLMGCGDMQKEIDNGQRVILPSSAQRVLGLSTVVCADGNQVRMAVYGLGGNSSAFTGWTILNPDGTPKRCVKRPKASTQYEEVPQ